MEEVRISHRNDFGEDNSAGVAVHGPQMTSYRSAEAEALIALGGPSKIREPEPQPPAPVEM